MAYEPLTPYKSKDDPLWYVFDENQNFKTFDTRDKAMNHIKAIKYPQNEGIEFNTSNTENQKIEPIKPQKIEFATDESNKEKKEVKKWLKDYKSMDAFFHSYHPKNKIKSGRGLFRKFFLELKKNFPIYRL